MVFGKGLHASGGSSEMEMSTLVEFMQTMIQQFKERSHLDVFQIPEVLSPKLFTLVGDCLTLAARDDVLWQMAEIHAMQVRGCGDDAIDAYRKNNPRTRGCSDDIKTLNVYIFRFRKQLVMDSSYSPTLLLSSRFVLTSWLQNCPPTLQPLWC